MKSGRGWQRCCRAFLKAGVSACLQVQIPRRSLLGVRSRLPFGAPVSASADGGAGFELAAAWEVAAEVRFLDVGAGCGTLA